MSAEYAVVYAFDVKPGSKASFIQAWEELTRLIYAHESSLGSRLHRTDEQSNRFIAYAQWPSKVQWENMATNLPETAQKWQDQMREACSEITTLYRLTTEIDLLA